MSLRLRVAQDWRGQPVGPDEAVDWTLTVAGERLRIEVDAPFHGDPPPPGAPGPTPRLWEHEVVELFIVGPDDSYVELELSPHGHHLVLRLAGRRDITEQGLPLDYQAHRQGARWTGLAHLPLAWLPAPPHRVNAYAIHGQPRRHLAWVAVPGDAPDFHRLERFERVDLRGRRPGS